MRRKLRPLLILIGVVFVLGVLVFHHFLLVFAVAASIALFLAPLHKALTRALWGWATLSASLIVGLCTLTILVPVLVSAILIGKETAVLLETVSPQLEPAALERLYKETLPARYPWLGRWIASEGDGQPRVLSEALSGAPAAANAFVQRTVAGVTAAVAELFLFLLMLFFLLRDGPKLRSEIGQISPLSSEQEDHVFDHLTRTVKGVLRAMIVVPIVQGIVALPGFLLFGVPAPMLWSVMVVLAALVPILGSPLAWVPACIYLFVKGQTWQWVGLLVYGLVLISGIDNVIKPLLLREAARIHPLLGFLAILGGILSFGPPGFLVGPVILSLVISALRIYRLDVLPATGGLEVT